MALCLILVSVPFAAASSASKEKKGDDYQKVKLSCTDVPKSGDFHDAVARIVQKSLSEWANGSKFKPDANFTRNDFYIILYRNFREEFPNTPEHYNAKQFPFKKSGIDPESELGQALIFCYKQGLFQPGKAYGDGEKMIERAEVISCLYQMYKKLYRQKNNVNFEMEYEVKGFSDVKKTHDFAQAAMWSLNNKLDEGFSTSNKEGSREFRPTGKKGRCTRKQLALLLLRISRLSLDP